LPSNCCSFALGRRGKQRFFVECWAKQKRGIEIEETDGKFSDFSKNNMDFLQERLRFKGFQSARGLYNL